MDVHPGKLELLPDDEEFAVAFNKGQEPVELPVSNPSDRPVQVGSHFHLAEVNEGLVFDRDVARGMRLHIPSGTSERFEPGDKRTVWLVPIGGTASSGDFRPGRAKRRCTSMGSQTEQPPGPLQRSDYADLYGPTAA